MVIKQIKKMKRSLTTVANQNVRNLDEHVPCN